MVQGSDGPELNQFKDSHGSKKDSGIRAGSVRHVLEDFVVVINRTKPVKRPVFRDSDSDHIGDGNQAAIAVILMIAGVGGIGAIVAHDEHADYFGKISFHDDFCLVVSGDICRLRDLLPVRGGEFRCVLYSYGDSGHLFADMYVCLDRVVHVDDFFLPDYRGGGDLCTFDFLEFRERHLAGY